MSAKSISLSNDDYIILMKAGPYCGYGLEEIVQIKEREERKCAKFYWGYGGVLCHPKRVTRFAELAYNEGKRLLLLFTLTPSNFNSPIGRAFHYSTDNSRWRQLPKDVLLVGNKYAVVAKGLYKTEFQLDLCKYRSVLGDVKGKRLDQYLKYRTDKACAVYESGEDQSNRQIKVSYISELVPPYCIYVK